MARIKKKEDSGEFLWLTSLSDLMILLFVFFVMLFSFTYKKGEDGWLILDHHSSAFPEGGTLV